MEREIADLKLQLAQQTRRSVAVGNLQPGIASYGGVPSSDQWIGSEEAVAGLLDLRSGIDNSNSYGRTAHTPMSTSKRLENVVVTNEQVAEVFQRFFTYQHPFCPFLNPEKSPDHYMSMSLLLFWVIVGIGARHYTAEPSLYSSLAGPVTRLIWRTICEVPQSYHVVKALALLCQWPFPTSSTSTDPTFILCGTMMQSALQMGLHRPSHAQDFSKFRIELRGAELKDRVRTWAICNIVAQRVATGYGQPANTLYDWTLGSKSDSDENFRLPSPILNPLLIEQFIDKVSKTLYTNRHDPVGLGSDHERATYVSFLVSDFEELEEKLQVDTSPITNLYLRAAHLHLRLISFFSPPSKPSYQTDLLKTYHATKQFIEAALDLGTSSTALPTPNSSGHLPSYSLKNASNYLFQMVLAAGFALLKLNYSFLRQHGLDIDSSKDLFRRVIFALRGMSVGENDLAERLAEVLAQVWLSGRVRAAPDEDNIGVGQIDKSLSLKVRCRMSMSLVYDSVWRWRENFQLKGKSLEAYLANPTDPTATINNSSASSMAAGEGQNTTLAIEPTINNSALVGQSVGNMIGNMGYSNTNMGYGGANYEVFDPLNWMLDGLVDFPYSLTALQGLEQHNVDGANSGALGV